MKKQQQLETPVPGISEGDVKTSEILKMNDEGKLAGKTAISDQVAQFIYLNKK